MATWLLVVGAVYSLPAQDLELDRKMKIYSHNAASSLKFKLKTEQEEIFREPLSLTFITSGQQICLIQG